jgi:hypothetical protein
MKDFLTFAASIFSAHGVADVRALHAHWQAIWEPQQPADHTAVVVSDNDPTDPCHDGCLSGKSKTRVLLQYQQSTPSPQKNIDYS